MHPVAHLLPHLRAFVATTPALRSWTATLPSLQVIRKVPRTEPPKNVPVPVKPAVANENSVEGFYQSIAFFGAASEYYGRTGKTEPLRESGIDISELKTTLEPTPGSFDDALQKGEVWRQEQTVTVRYEYASTDPRW